MAVQEKQITWNARVINTSGNFQAQPGDLCLCDPVTAGGPIQVAMPTKNGKLAAVKRVSGGPSAVTLTNLPPIDSAFASLASAGQAVVTEGFSSFAYVVAVASTAGSPAGALPTQTAPHQATGLHDITGINVDTFAAFIVDDCAAGADLTLAAPSDVTPTLSRFIHNKSAVVFNCYGKAVPSGTSILVLWNGSAWVTTV